VAEKSPSDPTLAQADHDRAEQLQHAQRLETIGRLAGGVAHDFSNLLVVISGYIEMVRLGLPDGDERAEKLDYALRASARASELARHLLTFSRRQERQPRRLDFNALAEEIVEMVGRLIGEHVNLVIALGQGTGVVLADAGEVGQIVMNLAVNARDAMAGSGRLTIETAPVTVGPGGPEAQDGVVPGDYAMLAVHDTGVGMDAATLAQIFEPFFTTKGPGKGTGLGLSTVHAIVEQSGGHIRAESSPGRGTTFRVYLPRVAGEAEPSEPPESRPPSRPGTETVLVVEDVAALCGTVREWLQQSGYTVLTATRPAEAIGVAEAYEGPIHLLLADVVMPEMTGSQLAAVICAKRPETIVLYMSGYEEQSLVRQGTIKAGSRFIQKPFTVHTLGRKVRDVLD
jgi:nitrogen-specific signal transduction histidine kinase/CheY-like chemotaxis protein